MRFTSILLALPLIGSVFAAPAAYSGAELESRSYGDIVEKRCPSGTCGGGSGINGVDGVIAIFADIKAQLDVVPKASLAAKAEVTAALNVVINQCTTAFTQISADVDLKAKLAICTSTQKKAVAKAVADVIIDINAILASIDASVLVDVDVKAALWTCNDISAKLFLAIDACISGTLKLALNVCVSVGIKLSGLFTCLGGSLTTSLSGLLCGPGGLFGGGGLLGLF